MFHELLLQTSVDLGQAMKNPIAQRRIQPGVGSTDTVFNTSFISGLSHSSGFNIKVIVSCQLDVNVVEVGIVAVGFDDESLQVIRQNHLGHPTKKTQRLVDAVDEVGCTLTGQGDGKGVLRMRHHADQNLRFSNLARLPVDPRKSRARKVELKLFSGLVVEGYRQITTTDFTAEVVVELARSITVRVLPLVLLVQQLLVDADARQFLDPTIDFAVKNNLPIHHWADLVWVEDLSKFFG